MAEKARPYVTRSESFRLELLVGESRAVPILLQLVIEFTRSADQSLFVIGFGGLVPSEELQGRRYDPVCEDSGSNGRV